ncbi:unnamed protein product [Polarella glacialis]|uniref:Uncharacterized protein n=1 Tax=Polarella glacialis TaxID=89957 RepID=A0A813DHE7_POLGL|nr:unnamed protein product [Polarella glacialis]CAE8740678.1 unnamed protein product [Polarella glacialis]
MCSSSETRLDCLFISSPKLRNLQVRHREEGFLAIPQTVRRLDLSGSRLRTLPEVGLGHLSELRVLNLEFNELVRLPVQTFHGLRHLKVLWLTGNHYGIREPEYLKMKQAGNRIEVLAENQFEGLQGLQVLLMHHNRLSELPEGLLRGLGRLRVLKLLDNPFEPRLSRKHAAFAELLEGDALQQLDLYDDSGDSLEDMWEETGTYLADDFTAGPLPPLRSEL